MSSDSLLEFLADPRNYPEAPKEITRLETATSWLFFSDTSVYKFKKPVRFNGLDYSTLAARERACQREVRLNECLARGVYDRILPVFDRSGSLSFEGEGDAREVGLKMHRIPSESLLDRRLAGGEVTQAQISAICGALTTFYRSAKSGEKIARAGAPATLAQSIHAALNVVRTRQPDEPRWGMIENALLEYLAIHRKRFEARAAQGKVRDGHGDLRAAHVALTDPPIILDRVEYNDRARHLDVVADVASLLFDLEVLERADLSEAIWRALAEELDETDVGDLLDFYRAHAGLRRCKRLAEAVDSLEELSPEDRSLFDRYLERAGRCCQRFHHPRLFLTTGLMGTGKSTLAQALSQELGLERISAEEVFAEQTEKSRAETETASPPVSRAASPCDRLADIYLSMNESARKALRLGQSVILDGRFVTREQRSKAIALAADLRIEPLVLECRLSKNDAIARLDRRFRKNRTRAGCRPELYEDQQKHFEPLDDIPADQILSLGTHQPVLALVQQVIERMADDAR